jgi:hypothetical protein
MKQALKFRNIWSTFSESEEEEMVSFFLMQQMALGKDSVWFPYLQALPETLPLPHTRTDKELLALQVPSVISQAKERRESMRREYNDLKHKINAIFIDVEEDMKLKYSSFESYQWAFSMVSATLFSFVFY